MTTDNPSKNSTAQVVGFPNAEAVNAKAYQPSVQQRIILDLSARYRDRKDAR
jgi:hypothetical protein